MILSWQKYRQMTEEKKKKITKWFWIIITAPFALVILLLLLVALFAKIPSFKELEHPDNKLATQLIAEGGEVLATFHMENRSYLTYDQLAPSLVDAAVATEDVRFYKHSGIDFKSLGRVLVKTLLLRKEWITAVKIEREYTKNEIMAMYLNSIFFGSSAYGVDAAAKTYFAKEASMLSIEESAMLIGMVNKPTRYNPILHYDYALQRRNFVLGQMAKAGFLDKAACDSIQQIPIATDKFEVQDHNAGFAPYFRDMVRRDLTAKRPRRADYESPEDYSADSVRWRDDPVYGWLNKNKKPDGSRYDLDQDGLRIYTTINYKMQQYAVEAISTHLGGRLQKDFDRELKWKKNKPFANDVDQKTIDRVMNQARRWSDRWRLGRKAGLSDAEILKQFSEPVPMTLFAWNSKGKVDTVMTPDDSIRYCKGILRTGFVAIEPHTGYVKAYVGGPNYRYFKYDNVRQGRRQVGSTVKPFLYTLAMQEGYYPCDQVVCMPQTFDMPDGTTWTPRSTDKKEWIGTTVTLRWGLAHSSNNISAFLMKELGPAAMVRMMRQMGVSTHLDEVYSLCVGSAEVEIYNMVASINTFPSRGVFISPQYITRIEDANGNVLGDFSNRKREAISQAVAYQMVGMMQAVVNEGTGSRLRGTYGFKGQIAGKTGTTNDNSDGWFIGYTPEVTAGVWVGGEDRQVHFNSTAQGGGSNMALPIWAEWYKRCLRDPSTGLHESSVFVAPPSGTRSDCGEEGSRFLGGYGDMDPDGGEAGSHDEEEDYYFN